MKHQHSADATIRVELPTQDLEDLVDKVTDSAVMIIATLTASYILKSLFRGKP